MRELSRRVSRHSFLHLLLHFPLQPPEALEEEGESMTILLFSLLMAIPQGRAADMAYKDEDFGCVSQDLANRYTKDFGIDTRSFGGMELCRNDVDTKKLFNDLQIVEAGTFASGGSNNLIRGFVTDSNYYAWLKSMTRGMRRGNDIPTATAYNSMGYFTMQDGWRTLSTLGRVGVVIHEARHTAGYRHYPCNQGPYAGVRMDGCDRDYQTGGSHSVEMEYYARVQVQGQNFHPAYRSMARLMAMARANFVFNQPVMNRREALLAVDQTNGNAVLFDRGQAVVRPLPNARGVLKRTSFGAVLFDGLKAISLEMYGSDPSRTPIKDDYSYFKLLERPTQPLKDLEEYDLGVKRYLVGINGNDTVANFVFGQGNWGPARSVGVQIARTATTLADGRKGYFLIEPNGAIRPFDADRGQVGASVGTWDSSLVNVALDDGGRPVALRTDGRLFSWNGQDWSEWLPGKAGRWSNVVNVPLYDAFDVSK